MPEGEGAERLRTIMESAQEILRDHPVNQTRGSPAARPAATALWFWGQGTRPAVPTLKERFGVEGSVISAVDLVNGVGRLAGLEVITVPGATGFLDTDYASEGSLWPRVAGAPGFPAAAYRGAGRSRPYGARRSEGKRSNGSTS